MHSLYTACERHLSPPRRKKKISSMHVSSNDALIELVSKNFCCASPKSAPCKKTCFKVRGSLQETHIGRYSPFKR